MIEVKNLKKTYVTKGNVITKALDDVSITFPEKGLIFLLGKSGSGKSTLLNICGGLDKADSGEVIIMGRSSASFSGSDFDSYRNTFIGFIFQDYNILSEFTVEENLSLALELQGKKANKEKVKELLKDVDLEGFGKRKPNTLSGGQKQRIAIARALIKEPKIIMADEPTGALDSKTGKQVFDTLKKLSNDHLIIVVSHDREFAEVYGDRIIELKDGQILSDETKTNIPSKNINENISLLANNTLSINNTKELTQDDKDKIIKYITESESIIISNNNDDIASFKKANRISDDNKTETFINTKVEDIQTRGYSDEEKKFIKSKLPLTKAARMGLSSLKIKPIRLLFTMFLTIVSFLLFGVSSSLMTYNQEKVFNKSFAKSDYTSIEIENNYKTHTNYYYDNKLSSSYDSTTSTYFTQEEVDNLNNKYGDDVLPIYCLSYDDIPIQNVSTYSETPAVYQKTSIKGFSTPNKNSKYNNITIGRMPEANNEIAISDFMATSLLMLTIKDATDTNIELPIESKSNLINIELTFKINSTNITFKICGIYQSDDIPSKFNGYDNINTVTGWDNDKKDQFKTFISESTFKVVFITNDAYKDICSKANITPKNMYYSVSDYTPTKELNIEINEYQTYLYEAKAMNEYNNDIYFINGNDKSSSGIVLPIEYFINAIESQYYSHKYILPEDEKEIIKQKAFSSYDTYVEEKLKYADKNATTETKTFFYEYLLDYYNINNEATKYELFGDYTRYNEIINSDEYVAAYNKYQEYAQRYNEYFESDKNVSYYKNVESYINLFRFYKLVYDGTPLNDKGVIYNENYSNETKNEIYLYLVDFVNSISAVPTATIGISSNSYSQIINRDIIGFYNDPGHTGLLTTQEDLEIMRSESYSVVTTDYEAKESEYYYSSVFVPTSSNEIFKDIESLHNDGTIYKSNNTLYINIQTITSFVNILKTAFLYVGITLAVFSALLLFNFITVSISNKTHEIGVLRAVGARGKDVFKIFFSESLFIALMSFIISLIGAIAIVLLLNNYMSNKLNYPLSLLTFGPLSIILMLSIAVAVAIVGTFIPVLLISRKKPVDSLRAQ